jgi:hypothetical protein
VTPELLGRCPCHWAMEYRRKSDTFVLSVPWGFASTHHRHNRGSDTPGGIRGTFSWLSLACTPASFVQSSHHRDGAVYFSPVALPRPSYFSALTLLCSTMPKRGAAFLISSST